MKEFLPEIATGIVTAFTTWFFTRKKQAADIERTELDNVDKATGIWRQLAKDMKEEVDQLRDNQQELFEEQHRILNENRKLREEVVKLEKKVAELTKENKKNNT